MAAQFQSVDRTYNVCAMHFIYYINSLTVTKVDSTNLGCLTSSTQRICPVAGFELMTTGPVAKCLTLSPHK